jgi:hypothetical protein
LVEGAADDVGVGYVGPRAAAQALSDLLRAGFVELIVFDADDQASKASRPRPTPPSLRQRTRGNNDIGADVESVFDHRGRTAIGTLEGDQRSGVEDETSC